MVDKSYFILLIYIFIMLLVYSSLRIHAHDAEYKCTIPRGIRKTCLPMFTGTSAKPFYILIAAYLKISGIAIYAYSVAMRFGKEIIIDWRRINTKWFFSTVIAMTLIMSIEFAYEGKGAFGRERMLNYMGAVLFLILAVGIISCLIYFKYKLNN